MPTPRSRVWRGTRLRRLLRRWDWSEPVLRHCQRMVEGVIVRRQRPVERRVLEKPTSMPRVDWVGDCGSSRNGGSFVGGCLGNFPMLDGDGGRILRCAQNDRVGCGLGNHPHLNLPPSRGKRLIGALEGVVQRSPSRGEGGLDSRLRGNDGRGAGMTEGMAGVLRVVWYLHYTLG